MSKVIDFEVQKRWLQISAEDRDRLLGNGFCMNCGVATFSPGYELELDRRGNIIIEGKCFKCKSKMARVVEKEWYDESGSGESAYSDRFNELFEYDAEIGEFGEANPEIEGYLSEFAEWLMDAGLSDKTILKHMNNVSLYLIDYLCYYLGGGNIAEGCFAIGGFLGDWFIRKCMWSSKTTIKDNAAGIKKFYKCMMEHGYVEEADYRILCDEIKDNMDIWLAAFDDYMSFNFDSW